VSTAEILAITPDPALPSEASAALARVFQAEGLPVRGCRVVPADDAEAERALREAIGAGGVVACLGEGDGAETARQVLARLGSSRLVLHERMLEAMAAAYARRGRAMPRRAERLALIPQGATVLVAAGGGEPAFVMEIGGAAVAVLPGDAELAAALAREHLVARAGRLNAGPVTVVRTLRLVGIDAAEAEAALAAALRGTDGVAGRAVTVGSEVWARLSLRGPTPEAARRRLRDLAPALRAELGAAWYAEDEDTLEVVVGRLLRGRRLTVALAESCTGGLIGHRLTQVPGSSAYLERGFVVYSNAAKQELLGVPEAVLAQHGAVSAECAAAMARGARHRARTDLGLSATGIAGPDGATATKPVGLIFIGLADAHQARVDRFRFDRDREGNKALAAQMALDLLRRYCLDPKDGRPEA
jgi:nicotinamide-nucleotide amidase